MVRGFEDLQRAEAAVKHMIVLTDGQTPEADFAGLVRRMRAANVSVTTVAVGSDANMPLLQEIARQGRGKFYPVHKPRNLPRIFLNEVRRVSRPLVYEPPLPVVPQVVADHEILSGLVEGVPPITGLVLTSVKESPLVEVVLRSPQPANPKNATVLATWSFGAGKAAAFTSDAGRRWAISWPGWEGYDKFFGQLVRWAMRPTDDAQRYAVAANVREGRTQIVVTAMDADEEVAGASSMTALAIAPDMTAIGVRLEQAAPGRFIGEFASPDAGTYLIAVHPGGGAAPLRTGVNVGYSPEYRDFQTNQPLLQSLAELRAGAGPSGEVAPVDPERALPPAASSNPFRRDLPAVVASRTVWPWVVVAASCLFWADVFVRRVQIDWSWAARVWEAWSARWGRRPPVAEAAPTMARLRSRKSEVATQLADRQRAASYPVGPPPTSTPGDESPRSEIAPVRDAPPAVAPPREASYTERLLQAKRDAQRRARDGDGR